MNFFGTQFSSPPRCQALSPEVDKSLSSYPPCLPSIVELQGSEDSRADYRALGT